MPRCAGLGTRLRPLTDWLAKPMVPVGDAPVLGVIASRIHAAGFDRLVVNGRPFSFTIHGNNFSSKIVAFDVRAG